MRNFIDYAAVRDLEIWLEQNGYTKEDLLDEGILQKAKAGLGAGLKRALPYVAAAGLGLGTGGWAQAPDFATYDVSRGPDVTFGNKMQRNLDQENLRRMEKGQQAVHDDGEHDVYAQDVVKDDEIDPNDNFGATQARKSGAVSGYLGGGMKRQVRVPNIFGVGGHAKDAERQADQDQINYMRGKAKNINFAGTQFNDPATVARLR